MPAIVRLEHWISDNEDHLLDLYNMLQESNGRTGRLVFDRDKCSFPQFCQLAYRWSTLYTNDSRWMYTEEEVDEDDYVSES